jgi:hypothetical protein
VSTLLTSSVRHQQLRGVCIPACILPDIQE